MRIFLRTEGCFSQVSLTQCVAGIVVAVQAHALGKLSLIGENIVAQAIWLSGSALADILITATLSWTVSLSKSSCATN